jgi:hypothetical protein
MILVVASLLALTAWADDAAPVDNNNAVSSTTGMRSSETIKWQVIAAGATKAASTNFRLGGTMGQTAVGGGSSPSYSLDHGFWQPEGFSGCCVVRGDINHSGSGPDISDLVYLVTYMFQGGPVPPCSTNPGYYDEADVNGSGTGPDISDLVYLVTYMFQSGPAPIACP